MVPQHLHSSPAAVTWPLPFNKGCRPFFGVVEGHCAGMGGRGSVGECEGRPTGWETCQVCKEVNCRWFASRVLSSRQHQAVHITTDAPSQLREFVWSAYHVTASPPWTPLTYSGQTRGQKTQHSVEMPSVGPMPGQTTPQRVGRSQWTRVIKLGSTPLMQPLLTPSCCYLLTCYCESFSH